MFKHALGRVGSGVILVAATLGVVTVAAPGTALAASGNVTCTTEIAGTTITGNVAVPAGAECFLADDTVQGNVSVGEGAVFIALHTVMERNLSTEGAYTVNLVYDEVDGNSSFDATSDTVSICGFGVSVCQGYVYNPGTPNPNPNGNAPTSKFGNVSITNTSPAGVVYAGNYVAGNLTCSGNTFVTNIGVSNIVLGQESGQCAGL